MMLTSRSFFKNTVVFYVFILYILVYIIMTDKIMLVSYNNSLSAHGCHYMCSSVLPQVTRIPVAFAFFIALARIACASHYLSTLS